MKKLIGYLLLICLLISCGIKVKKDTNPNSDLVGWFDILPLGAAQDRIVYDNPESTPASSDLQLDTFFQLLPPGSDFRIAQATALNNHIYVSYYKDGIPFGGHLDIIEILPNNQLTIVASIQSSAYDFKEFQIKNNYFYLSAENAANVNLMTLDISDKQKPVELTIKKINAKRINNLDLAFNSLMSSSSNTDTVSKFILHNPQSPAMFSLNSNTNFSLHSLDYDFNFNEQGIFYSGNNIPMTNESISLSNQIKAIRQNSLLYFIDFSSNLFSTLDYSGLLNSTPLVSLIEQGILPEAFSGMSNNEQKFYLTNETNLIYIINNEIPHQPEIPISVDLNRPTSNFINTWSDSRHDFIFLEDIGGLLRVWKKVNINQAADEIKFYAKGNTVSGESSQVLIRVNDEDFQTINLSDFFTSYTLNYSRNLTNSDEVSLIFLNPTNSAGERPAIVSYLKLLNQYCYQQMTATHDDIGLVEKLHTLKFSPQCETTVLNQLCTPNEITQPNEPCELPGNKQGQKTCSSDGRSYECQDTGTCLDGFSLIGGLCVAPICVAGATQDCSTSTTIQVETCNGQGTSYENCAYVACQTGHVLYNSICLPQICIANTTEACSDNNGSGNRTCINNGSSYGACLLNSCDAGYYLSNGVCVAQTCSPGSNQACAIANGTGTQTCNIQGSEYNACIASGCDPSFNLSNNICVPNTCTPGDTQSCPISNGVGSQTCEMGGNSWTTCAVVSCLSGFHSNGGICESNTRSCLVTNGSGVQTWNGGSYDSCVAQSCDSGHYLSAGLCVAQSCSPGTTQACAIANGEGIQTCDSQGSAYNTCSINFCNSGYHQSGNVCESNTRSCVSANGTGTQTWNGSSYGACLLNSCDSGFYLSGGLCFAQTCSPSTSQSCAIANGTGTQTCNAQGSDYGLCSLTTCNSGHHQNGNSCDANTIPCSVANGSGTQTWNGSSYGACVANSCNGGFYLNGGICTAQVCAPSSTQSCSITNGSGSQTCNAQGSSYNSCTLASCNPGFHPNGNSCDTDTIACSVSNGSGTQTWNGSSYGTCNVTSCSSGFYNNGSACVAQICTSGNTQSCSITNGVGTQSCNTSGTGYNSCMVSSCNGGFHNSGINSCDANTRTCAIANGSGTQTWNGSSYGTCTVTSCISDAYQSGNSCVLYCPNPLLVHVILFGAHVCI